MEHVPSTAQLPCNHRKRAWRLSSENSGVFSQWKDSSHTVREAGRPPEQPPEAKAGAQDVPGFAGSRDGLQRSAQRA